MTTVCMPITPARGTRSLLSTVPETGRGQASLWTAAAAPDHRLWTTLRGPWTPLEVAHLPPPTTTVACSRNRSITTNQRRDDLRTLLQAPVAEPALANIDSPPNRWAIPEHQSGPYRLVKSNPRGSSRTNRQRSLR